MSSFVNLNEIVRFVACTVFAVWLLFPDVNVCGVFFIFLIRRLIVTPAKINLRFDLAESLAILNIRWKLEFVTLAALVTSFVPSTPPCHPVNPTSYARHDSIHISRYFSSKPEARVFLNFYLFSWRKCGVNFDRPFFHYYSNIISEIFAI